MPDDPLASTQRALDAARARKRRQEMGPPLALSDLDLDTLSNVGPTDAPLAEAVVRDAAGAVGEALWNATPEGLDRQPAGRV
jgi:hypothetical protein